MIYDPTPVQLPRIWNQVEPLLWKVIKHSELKYEPLDVFVWHIQGLVKIWIYIPDGTREIEAVVVTRIMDYPLGKVLVGFLCGGKSKRIKTWADPMQKTLEAYGRSMGCTELETGGRPGWERVWEGLENHGVILRKKL